MKNILVFLVFTFSNICFAQTFVSTTAENKKAFLEMYCGYINVYDPDGHAFANTIKSNYPNDFFISKVHFGAYATPSGPGTDFTTPFGSIIGSAAGVSGFPTGSIEINTTEGTINKKFVLQ